MVTRRLIAVLLFFMSAAAAYAQIRIISREKLDSVSNPALAADAAALKFDVVKIVAEPMNEDDAPKLFRFPFRNVSDSDIRISRVVSTCSCASVRCDRTEVAPGQQAEVLLTYDPKGHPGRFERKVFIYTGSDTRPSAILRLAVDVSAGADDASLFPVSLGRIRTRSTQVKVNAAAKSVERLRFLNVSGSPLRLQCDEMMLPSCLSFRSEPETVGPSEEGDIVIVFDPEEYARGPRRDEMKIILNGMDIPPSQSSITIKVEK